MILNNLMLAFVILSGIMWFYIYFGLYFVKEKTYNKLYKGKVCLIVPSYNEDLGNLENTIINIKKVKRFDHIIFINDGSDRNSPSKLFRKYLTKDQFVDNKINQGKRHAQLDGINKAIKLFGKNYFDTFVTIDSDTIVDEQSIIELLKPMVDKNIGGTTGQVLVLNRNDNILTKCSSAMFWSSNNIWRKSPSNYGYLQVTNGALACYRAKYIIKMLPEYTNQIFMGKRCNISDDRWLTQHMQTDYNKKMIYVEKALVYTYIPTTIKATYKMLLRWKRGSLRESLLIMKNIKKTPQMVIDIALNLIIAVFQVVIRLGLLIFILFYYPIGILYYILSLAIISLIYALEMVIKNPKEVPYRIGYSIYNEFIFGWVTLHAIFTFNKQGTWATR